MGGKRLEAIFLTRHRNLNETCRQILAQVPSVRLIESVIGTPLHTRGMYSRFVKGLGPNESKRLFSLLDVEDR